MKNVEINRLCKKKQKQKTHKKHNFQKHTEINENWIIQVSHIASYISENAKYNCFAKFRVLLQNRK